MPRLLDLFCGGGGASAGYARAGFDVTGVDIAPQPGYPYTFIQGDVIDYLTGGGDLSGFDAIHASPPCQAYSTGVTSRSSKWVPTLGKDEPALIGPVHSLLAASGVPWVIENVMGARRYMPGDSFILCGSMFGRPISRHRVFATSWSFWPPYHDDCRGLALRSSDALAWDYRDMSVTGKGRRAGTSQRWAHLLGIDWPMSQHQLAEAIPPAYTEFLGAEMLTHMAGVHA